MKIIGIDVFGYDLHYAHGTYVMSGGRSASMELGTLVRLRTDEDIDGWGEVTPLGTTYLPAYAGGVRRALEALAQSLADLDPTHLSLVNRRMDTALMGHRFAKSAIDIACWDIYGKAVDRPVVDLLGGRLQPDFPLYEAVPLDDPDVMADFVTARSEAGITRFQLKVGNDPKDDIARVVATRTAAPSDAVIVADSNGGWGILQAQIAIRGIEGLDVYIEQPCRETEDCIIAHRGSTLPLVLDESILTIADVYRAKIDAGAASINVKISRVGGLTKAALMRDVMQELDLAVSIEDTWGGDVITSAVSHIAASTKPEMLANCSFFNDWNDGHVAGYVPRSEGGRGAAPSGPGLGIEVDVSTLGNPLLTIDC